MENSLKELVSHFKLAWYILLALLVLLFLGLSAFNAKSIDSVSIRVKSGVEEPKDKIIPFVNKENESLPDYELSYMEDNHWKVVGTKINTSAKDWLEYKISDPPNMTLVQSLRITEKDKAIDDVVEEVQVVDESPEGNLFEYSVTTTYSFKSGMWWFATTPLGVAIFAGIGVAVFIVVLSNM